MTRTLALAQISAVWYNKLNQSNHNCWEASDMDLKKMKVICTGKMRPIAYEALKDKVNLVAWQAHGKMPKEMFDENIADAEALFLANHHRVDEALLARAPKLKIVATASVGYDHIDVAACRAHGVKVGNTPGVLVNAVADIAYGLLIDTARMIRKGDAHVKSGMWGTGRALGFGVDLYNKTLGIVGMGDIGSAIARRAQVSGMNVIYHNRHRKMNDSALGVTYAEFDDLLAQSDFIVIAVTLNPSTENLFDEKTFARMKQGVRLVNISRGRVVDTNALYNALVSGRVAAAGLDVTEPEPLPGDNPLCGLDNITITPHIASATVETRDAMAMVTAENILRGLKGQPLLTEVR